MQLELASCSDTGQVRDHNEDALIADATLGLVVLADGMGGYQAGEVASELAVQTIQQVVQQRMQQLAPSPSESPQPQRGLHHSSIVLEQAVLAANEKIFIAAENESQYQGMGTTVVAALFAPTFISIAHVGDSRLYRLRDAVLQPITVDHSVLQELIECGFFTPEQARHSPNRNLVTRALGVSEAVAVDVQEQALQSGDLFLLCSDGLNDMLEDREIQRILNRPHSLSELAQQLVDAANAKGGEDNISVLLARPHLTPTEATEIEPSWWQRLFNWNR
jgi:protein phosphatase